jgi:hypothetical protein
MVCLTSSAGIARGTDWRVRVVRAASMGRPDVTQHHSTVQRRCRFS